MDSIGRAKKIYVLVEGFAYEGIQEVLGAYTSKKAANKDMKYFEKKNRTGAWYGVEEVTLHND